MAEEPKAPAGSGPEKAAAKPTAKPPAKPSDTPEPWADPLREALEKRFPSALTDALVYRNQPSITVVKDSLIEVCRFLRDDDQARYTYPTDVTAVDYPGREKRFEVIYHLYSFQRNDRLRVKVLVGEGEPSPSLTGLWSGANWQEREVFDMFGIVFAGHPNLKRVLLPEDWVGHPLRKDYDILKQDKAWVKANLNIESGQ
ncbi:MAG: NADH-quinone oxidoreductase subunit C [Acidobacteria bacterium]|nr:NADH-quinone oxidoreductase subunit C [Acidobacteriota bacterium]